MGVASKKHRMEPDCMQQEACKTRGVASTPPSSTTLINELDEQLTCSVCLDKYTNPKTLPCHHSFCLDCIERLPQQLQVNTHTHIHVQFPNINFSGLLTT